MGDYKGQCNQKNYCGTMIHEEGTDCPKAPTGKRLRAAPAVKASDLFPATKPEVASPTVTELSFVQGTSDKFYRVEVDGNVVRITNGKNGTVGTQQKPKEFDDAESAAKFAGKQLASKLKKGYQPVESTDSGPLAVTEFDGPNLEAVPMLAKVADPDTVRSMIADFGWHAQVKMDGDRLVVSIGEGKTGAFNRQGMAKQRNVGQAHLDAFEDFEGDWIIDGEVVGTTYHVFDVLKAPGMPENASFEERYARISEEFNFHGLHGNPAVALVATAVTPEEKQALRDETRANRGEGLIFRRKNAPYTHGRSDALMKDKFTKSADLIVMSSNSTKGKESVEVGVRVNGKLVRVGSLSTIGKGTVNEGDVVEASFKHVVDTANPILVEGRIERVRTDKSADECGIEQFEHAGTNIGKDG